MLIQQHDFLTDVQSLFLMVVPWLVGLLVLWFVISVVKKSYFMIGTKRAGVVTRWRKFHKIAQPGLNWKVPFMDRLEYTEDLSKQLMDVPVASKTKDDATVTVYVRVQYYVLPDKVQEAYYEMDDPESQIKAHIENVILSHVPTISLDDCYVQETTLADKIKATLVDAMQKFGYALENALVQKIVPAEEIVRAMNHINAAKREQTAAEFEGEAAKIKTIAAAKANAEAQHQAGLGVAMEREAIIEGLKRSIEDFEKATQVGMEEVMMVVMATQYFDMMKFVGQNSNTIMLTHSPVGLSTLIDDMRQAITTGVLTADKAKK